jgi:hypothetical protein
MATALMVTVALGAWSTRSGDGLSNVGSLVVVYLCYKFASTRLNRWLFPDLIAAQT